MDFYEFLSNLVYIVSSRPARASWRQPVSKTERDMGWGTYLQRRNEVQQCTPHPIMSMRFHVCWPELMRKQPSSTASIPTWYHDITPFPAPRSFRSMNHWASSASVAGMSEWVWWLFPDALIRDAAIHVTKWAYWSCISRGWHPRHIWLSHDERL